MKDLKARAAEPILDEEGNETEDVIFKPSKDDYSSQFGRDEVAGEEGEEADEGDEEYEDDIPFENQEDVMTRVGKPPANPRQNGNHTAKARAAATNQSPVGKTGTGKPAFSAPVKASERATTTKGKRPVGKSTEEAETAKPRAKPLVIPKGWVKVTTHSKESFLLPEPDIAPAVIRRMQAISLNAGEADGTE
jgi:hypothetical protein